MLRHVFPVLIVCLFLLPTAAWSASSENAKRLYDVSGLADTLRLLPHGFKEALNEDVEALPDASVRAEAGALVDKHFAFKDLEKGALTIIEAQLTDEQVDELIAYLSTGVGLRATELEKAAQQPELSVISDQEGREIYAKLVEADDPRVEIYDRMNRATKAVDSTIAMTLNTTYMLLSGVLSASGQARTITDDDLLAYVNALVPQITEEITEAAFGAFAYTYQDLSQDELSDYADFLETPPAKAFYDGQMLLFRTFLMARSQAFGHELMALMGARKT